MENSSERLTKAMAEAGRRNGFEDVTAEFSDFRDFKLRWTRSYKWISFEVSDYLRNAPENVIRSLADTVFARIKGDTASGYTAEVCEYLNSQEFLEENQGLFLKRFRGISAGTGGESTDLAESYRRLVESGLVEEDPKLVIRWNNRNQRNRKVGHASVLMRTVMVNPKLDCEDISDNVLDYALYSQICMVNMGFGPTREGLAERYDRILSEYPGRDAAETEFRRLELYL